MIRTSAILRPLLSIAFLGSMWIATPAQDLGHWRALTAEEEQARIADTPSDSIDPSIIEADFNGDGIKDRAQIAIRKSDQARGLIVTMKDRVHVLKIMKVFSEKDIGLGPAEQGSWDTICGTAFREFHEMECKSGYPSHVKLKNPGILFIAPGATMLYFWNPKTKGFAGVLMVD